MASASEDSKPKFYNYPLPLEGPNVPYKNEAPSNPVLRGLLLAIGAILIRSISFLQSILWGNTFGKLRSLKELDDYDPCYDPTVIPISDTSSPSSATADFPAPRKRKNGQCYYTAADYHEPYLSHKLTPTAVVNALLPLIRRDTSPPGEHSVAFLRSNVELIRTAAEASTERYKQGKPLSVLDGVPVAVKDEADLAGYKRTLGTTMDFTGKKDETAWCVKKWEEAGAIVLGKTNMHECGCDTSGNNPKCGTPTNPHNPHYYCGGSSSGSAYAVSAGLCPITLGADGGGSIRIPACFCGIYGLKPSHGRVSGRPTNDLASTTGVYGPMASSIDDLALAYRIMAAPDPHHKTSALFPATSIPPSLSTSRPKLLAVYQPWLSRADPSIQTLVQKSLDHYCTHHSYTIIDLPSFPLLPEGQKAHALTILSEIASGIKPSQIPHLTYPNQLLISVGGSQASAQQFLAAQKIRQLLMRHLSWLWREKYPGMILVSPTTTMAGWKIEGGKADLKRGVSDGNRSLRCMEYAYLANFCGAPAISFPVGYVEGGTVPIGLMGMAEWGQEEQLLEWGREGEGILDADGGEEGVGVKRPSGKEGRWVDVVELAGKEI